MYIWLCRDSVTMLAFTSCSEWGLRSSCLVQASRSSGFSCFSTQAPGRAGLSSWGSRAQQLHLLGSGAQAQYWGAQALLLPCIWHSPGSEIEPISPALVGGIFTTEPPGGPWFHRALCKFPLLLLSTNFCPYVQRALSLEDSISLIFAVRF